MPLKSVHPKLLIILALLDKRTEALDIGRNIDCLYPDFAKAFDPVRRERLLVKIHSYGITGKLWSSVKDFLDTRNKQQ